MSYDKNAYQRAYHEKNKERLNAKQRERYHKNKEVHLERQRWYQIEKKYGLSKEEYLELMDEASCEICGKQEDLCVDHSHSTGNVRGVLCRQCNQGIGLLGDEYETVLRAVEYLYDK